MALKNKKTEFDGIYQGIEEKEPGVGIIYTRKGHFSVMMRIENPVVQYAADIQLYYDATNVFENIIRTLGEGYSLQKQDVFSRQVYDPAIRDNDKFLSKAYKRFFKGREYTEIQTYLTITQEIKQSTFTVYDPKKEADFWSKIQKVRDILYQKKVNYKMMSEADINEYVHRYLAVDFRKGAFSFENFKAFDNHVQMGTRAFRIMDLIDIDEVVLPAKIKPFSVEDEYPMDLMSFLARVPGTDCVIYTQNFIIPSQRKENAKLQANMNRKKSIKDPGNQLAAQDIANLMNDIASDNKVLIYANYTIMVVVKGNEKQLEQPYNFIEKKLYDLGVGISHCAYNQMELFINNFPGNQFSLREYERFLCPHDAAVAMMFKEHTKQNEETNCPVNYTDRQGVPLIVDFTGKEGPVKLTTNSNLFALGPSGSGKSFHMNSVVRQLHDNGTDVVMVDTGNSYEGLCDYFHGTYVAYTEEKPITMNPFRITEQENNVEKRNFLKSLILLIWKGADAKVDKVSEQLIDTVIAAYYDSYFYPFQGYTEEQKQQMRTQLLLEYRTSGGEANRKVRTALQEKVKALDLYLKLENHEQRGIEEGERKNAALLKASAYETLEKMKLNKEDIDNYRKAKEEDKVDEFFERLGADKEIENEIIKYEERRRKIKVNSLSFNTFFEFSLEFIPLECELNRIDFNMNTYAYTLKPFYRGGEREKTLNDDFDSSLFDTSFIVFEIDAIKDDKILFPIVTLIIMDVFIQKMRLKSNRKALIIEEAWKAIASPLMAVYIKYLYKTVRKFWGIVGVVTQELDDIISNETVKQTIISNSEITILLDQSKFRENFSGIKKLLGLTDIECHKIWSINNLDNHKDRSFFKEVYIRRGQHGEVYGVEECPESYMAYTTERLEKDALKVYVRRFGGYEKGIEVFCKDLAQLFPPFTKADQWAERVNKALAVYTTADGDAKKGLAHFLADWAEFDDMYKKSLKRQIFPEHIFSKGVKWDHR